MTYNYKCPNENCGVNLFEVVHGMSEKPKVKCAMCESECKKSFVPPLGIKGANTGGRKGN